MFTTVYNPDRGRWEAYWNGTLYAIASTEHDINHYIRRWRTQ